MTEREILFNMRLREARGGEAAEKMGTLTGVTTAYWTYLYQSKHGFSFLPFHRNKLGKYTIILGAGYLAN